MKRDFPKESFPSAYSVIKKNPEFILAIAQAASIIEQQQNPVFENDKGIKAHFLKGASDCPYDYLFVQNNIQTFVTALNRNKSKEYKEALRHLETGYDRPIYFDLNIGSFYNRDLRGGDAYTALMTYDMNRMTDLLINNLPIEIKRGELASINVHLDIIGDFVKTLQHHQLFPQGDIDAELKTIGKQVAQLNSSDDFLPYLQDILVEAQALKTSQTHPLVYNDLDSRVFVGELDNSFVVKHNGKSGYVAHYLADTDTWNVYNFFPVGELKNEDDVFKLIRAHDNQPDLLDVTVQIQGKDVTWVSGSLADLHIDLFCANRETEEVLEEQKAKKSVKP